MTSAEKSEGRVKRLINYTKTKLRKTAEVFGYSQTNIVVKKSDKVVLHPKSKARKDIVYLIPRVNLDDCHLVFLDLTYNNCNCKETHLYARYV